MPHIKCIEDYITGFKTRQEKLVADAFSDDGIIIESQNNVIKKDDIENFLKNTAWQVFPDATFEILMVFGNHNVYCIEWKITIQRTNIQKNHTNEKLSLQGVDILKVKNHKICKAISYFDKKVMFDYIFK